jgi:hypothetical protein
VYSFTIESKKQPLILYKHKAFLITTAMLAVVFIGFAGCKKKNNLPHPDISNIVVDLHFERMEKPFMRADGGNYRQVLDSMQEQYPDFFQLLTNDILNMRSYNDSTYRIYDTLYHYMIADAYMLRLYDSVAALYTDISDVEQELETALRYYKYYFPDSLIPGFYTYVAPFVYQVVISDEVLAVELNMFMGKNFTYYSAFAANMPQYLLYRFDRSYMVVSIMRALMDGSIPDKGADANLLDEMIKEGKMMYYLDCMLPDAPDSVKIGFHTTQLDWCADNEADIWRFFAGEELFFSTRNQDKQRYIGEAPNAFGMPEGAPGRIGVWVGWQVVRKYMEQHPETTLAELFAITDGTTLLKGSGYKP